MLIAGKQGEQMSRVEVHDGLSSFLSEIPERPAIDGSKAGRIINLLDKRRVRRVVRFLWFVRRIPKLSVLSGVISLIFITWMFGGSFVSPFTLVVGCVILVAIAGWAGGFLVGQVVSVVSVGLMAINGSVYAKSAMDVSVNPFPDFLINVGIMGFVAYMSSAVSKILFYEQKSSHTDPLTGLANRRLLNEYFKGELQRSKRNYRPISVVFMDIDNFKVVNDRFGHMAGDSLLRTLADILLTSTRDIDSVARLGGDEFGLLLPETDEQGVRVMLERIRETFNWQVQCAGWPVSLSIGAAVFMAPPNDLDVCLDAADRLLSSVKENGKNNTMFVIFR